MTLIKCLWLVQFLKKLKAIGPYEGIPCLEVPVSEKPTSQKTILLFVNAKCPIYVREGSLRLVLGHVTRQSEGKLQIMTLLSLSPQVGFFRRKKHEEIKKKREELQALNGPE